MKKILALVLTLMTLLPLFVACGTPSEQPKETTGETKLPAEDDPFNDEVPDQDFEEWEFMIGAPEGEGPEHFDRTESTGDHLNDAIYNRNRSLETRFNIIISSLPLGETGTQAAAFQNYFVSGEDMIDLIGVATYQSGKPMITSGFALPWNDVEYINLDKPWWNKSVTKTLSILDNYYYLSGDINYSRMRTTMVTYFNKKVHEEFGIEDLYQMVKDQKWTQEAMMNLSKKVGGSAGDMDGDQTINPEKDRFGLIQFYHATEAWLYGSNYHTVVFDDEGAHMNFTTTKFKTIADRLYDMMYTNKTAYMTEDQSEITTIFFDNRALFLINDLGASESYRDQETDFGILPPPMYDESQGKYCSYADQWGLVLCLPATATDTSRTGAIVEAMAALSLKNVRPAYYDLTLMSKLKRDDESEEMLNITFDGLIYDMGITFVSDLGRIPLRTMLREGNTNIQSWWKSNQKIIETNFEELFEYVQGIEGETA